MAGSSKKVFHPRLGSPAAMQLTPKLALAPRPTRVLMSGAPLRQAFHPSTSSSRPGPVAHENNNDSNNKNNNDNSNINNNNNNDNNDKKFALQLMLS